MATRYCKTTIKHIADYWIKNSNISELELNFDWADAHTHCWNCGDDRFRKSHKTPSLERCHIVPHSLGGSDSPDNYVLLCKDCHQEAPNTNNPNDMWDWIKSNYMPFSFYGTYSVRKALIIFQEREGFSFIEKASTINNISDVIKNEFNNVSTHGAKTTISTYYYMFKTIIDKYT
jgi:hypothetical protein